MKKIYNIADIQMEINSDFEIEDAGYLELFRENDSLDVVDRMSYHIKVKDFSEVYQYTCKKEMDEQTLYEKDGRICRVFLDQRGREGFACIFGEDGVHKNQWDLYVTEKGKKELPSMKFLTNIMAPEMTLLSYDAVILHASNIKYKGKNILFSAPCQTGKSTQAALWEKHRDAVIVNGDRALIRKKDERFWSYGLPFCGSSDICKNIKGEIGALVLLEQGKENVIRVPGKKEAFLKIYQQITNNSWMPKNSMKIMDIVDELIKAVPIVILSCRPDIGAVEILENYLKEGGYIDY